MTKKKQKGVGSDDRSADFESRPDMDALDRSLRGLLKVPKADIDAKIQAEKDERKLPKQ